MTFSTAVAKLRKDGVSTIVDRRIRWYHTRLMGRIIALKGNKVYMDGMTYSVAPLSSSMKYVLAAGKHEQPERDLVRQWLPADIPLIELGGGLGVVSCLANRKLSQPDRHVVVEANPAMVPLLSENRDLNRCYFTIINRALGYDTDAISLDIDVDFVGSTAVGKASGRKIEVKTVTISEIMEDYRFENCGIICDIEGLESQLVDLEFRTLGDRIRYLLAEMHPAIIGQEAVQRILQLLCELGFIEKQRNGDCVFYARP